MLKKDSVVEKFLNEIYNDKNFTILSSNEIKEIENLFNKNYDKCSDINEFYLIDKNITKNIKKVKSVKAEVERQFSIKKRLQSGTLCECVIAETIAKKYNLKLFADVFHTYIRDLPANILYKLRDDDNRILCRYIYYNEEDKDTFLIQYGNPTRYDADLYINNEKVKIEFKDREARAGERETEYDETGKLIFTDKFAKENPDYIPIINLFNEKENMVKLTGNYAITDEKIRKIILKSYFKSLGFEILISIDENNQLIAITEDCIDFSKENKFISLDGSEIRRSGKNSYKIFTPKLLLESIKAIGGEIKEEIVSIPKSEMKDRTNNGKLTGKKINHLFFVPLTKYKQTDDKISFSINDVKQLKPTICAHMCIIASREELVSYYKKILTKE